MFIFGSFEKFISKSFIGFKNSFRTVKILFFVFKETKVFFSSSRRWANCMQLTQGECSFLFLTTKLPIYFQLPIFGNKTSNLFPASNFRQRKLPIFGNKTSNLFPRLSWTKKKWAELSWYRDQHFQIALDLLHLVWGVPKITKLIFLIFADFWRISKNSQNFKFLT